jgi:hypothetical protein
MIECSSGTLLTQHFNAARTHYSAAQRSTQTNAGSALLNAVLQRSHNAEQRIELTNAEERNPATHRQHKASQVKRTVKYSEHT